MMYLTWSFCFHFNVASDDVISSHTRDPLIRVVSGGRYSGNQLKTLINSLQGKLEGKLATEEFRVIHLYESIYYRPIVV